MQERTEVAIGFVLLVVAAAGAHEAIERGREALPVGVWEIGIQMVAVGGLVGAVSVLWRIGRIQRGKGLARREEHED